MTRLRRGLYAISDGATGEVLLDWGRAVLRGGAVLVQYRDKRDDAHARLADATRLLEICRARGVPLVINDDLALAAEIGADGCHVGRDDASLAEARTRLGDRAILGVSCYADLDLATAAVAGGADYVAFGSVFASPTKPQAPPVSLDLLRRARQSLAVPVCAIGGITTENAPALLEAGIDLLAVISALCDPRGPEAAARAFAALYAGSG